MDILPTLLLGSIELHIVDLSIILFWGAGEVKKNRTIYFATVGNNDNSDGR